MKQGKLSFSRSCKRKPENVSEPSPKKSKIEKQNAVKKEKKNIVEQLKAAEKENIVENDKMIEDSSEKKRYSNSMKDAVKTSCKICSEPVSLTTMRGHTKSAHKMSIADYKEKHGNHRNQIIEKIFHKCGLCQQDILLDSDDIAHHLKKCHQITHKDYNSRFMTLIKDDKSKPSSKKPSKTKNSKKDVVVKQSVTEKKAVKEIDGKKLETSFEMTTELCEVESDEDVTERRSEDTTTSVPAAIDHSDDDAGPSTGVRITEEQREENLWILQKLQRNILRRLHLDDDEDDDEDLETSEASSRSA